MPRSELGCEGIIDDIAIRVSIIVVNRYSQVTNGVGWSPSERHQLAQRLTYEMLWCMNKGWDNLTEENAAWSVDLRLQLILAGLLQQIAARPIPD
jgi:hypothetical protein